VGGSPDACFWNGCFSREGSSHSIAVPFAAKRSRHKDADGKQVAIPLVASWRKMWLEACGVTKDNVSNYMESTNLRVCRSHVPPSILDNFGVLIYNRSMPSDSVCYALHQNSPVK
jgi:hypothetical protein